MGNTHHILDIKGFECYHDDPNVSNLSLMLDCALSEGKERLEEIEDEHDREFMQRLLDNIEGIDGTICKGGHVQSAMSDACAGSEPLAIGWGRASEEKLRLLKEALEGAGFRVSPLYKDRFSTHC